MITRIDFIGFVVAVPQKARGERNQANYTPNRGEWVGWTVESKGAQVFFRNAVLGREIEVPRSVCLIYRDMPKEEAK